MRKVSRTFSLTRQATRNLLVALLGLAFCNLATAEIRCVEADFELGPKLDAALASANALEDVRITSGNYLLDSGPVGYSGIVVGNGKTLQISGGWSGGDAQCGSQNGRMASTVLWGMDQRPVFWLTAASNFSGTVVVENLFFGGGRSNDDSAPSCLSLGGDTSGSLAIRVDRVWVEGCVTDAGQAGPAVSLVSTGGLILRNSLVSKNDTGDGAAVVAIARGGAGFVLNNTIADNVSDSSVGNAGIYAAASGVEMLLANNLFDGNVATGAPRKDVRVGSGVTLQNNRFTGLAGVPVDDIGSSTGPAGFSGDAYALSASSTARDAGTVLIPAIQGPFDLAGQPRVQGMAVDLGALEYAGLFADGFESS